MGLPVMSTTDCIYVCIVDLGYRCWIRVHFKVSGSPGFHFKDVGILFSSSNVVYGLFMDILFIACQKFELD